MSNNLGCDIFVDRTSGDILIGDNGDFLTTDLIEARMTSLELPFNGFISLRETIYRIILGIKGSYPFDVNFGADLDNFISYDITETLTYFRERLEEEISRDDRVKSVKNIEFEQITPTQINIYISIIPIDSEQFSEFVYPYVLLNNV